MIISTEMKRFHSILLLSCLLLFIPLTSISASKVRHDKGRNAISIKPGNNLYGVVKDAKGKAVSGVCVTDGYQVVTTDAHGIYQMKRSSTAKYVYYTNPSGFQPDNNGFYQTLTAKKRYDFTLGSATGNDKHFNLLLLTDPQIRSDKSNARFHNETVPAMKQFIKGSSLPVVGLTLGDNVHEQHPELEGSMHEQLTGMGIPFFSAIGNHDYFKVNGSDSIPRSPAEYEKYWGPRWFSFNKGDAHFIILDDMKYYSGKAYEINGVISETQLHWMKEDLSHVDRSKLIIVGYHMPLTYKDKSYGRDEMFKLLAPYPNRILMAGHMHYMRHRAIDTPIAIEERIHAAGCGAFWWTTINRDGAPNGFSTYEINGNKIVNNKWVNSNPNMPEQIRLTYGDATFGGAHGEYSYGLPKGYIVANVWNWDPQWTVTISEDGGAPVKMEQGLQHDPAIKHDAWTDGYMMGVRGRKSGNFQAFTNHLFLYKLKNPKAKIVVTATDRYGNSYTQSKITTDFSECKVNGTDFKPYQ